MENMYLNKKTKEVFVKQNEDVNSGDITFINSENQKVIVPYTYYKEFYTSLSHSVETLEKSIKSFGDYMNKPVELSRDDHKNLLLIIKHLFNKKTT